MTKAQIVVGANFGDEGKGLTVDYLTNTVKNKIVVRHNGGAQAGHTVETDDMRHVFHHVGAGTLNVADTFLSRFFIVNPILFFKEYNELGKIYLPRGMVHVDVNAPLTTPYDMMINQASENGLGQQRLGSCGVGINETITRNEKAPDDAKTYVKDIYKKKDFREKLEYIRTKYIQTRQTSVGNAYLDPEMVASDKILNSYIEQCENFTQVIQPEAGPDFLEKHEHIVFEGAQGLLLDEFHQWFPHVTRSRTGVINAVAILRYIEVEEAEVYYVTRSYLTRHGAGPLPYEVEEKIYPKIEDKTNITNQYQGKLRYAPLNLGLMADSLWDDLSKCFGVSLIPNLMITCLDQLPEKFEWFSSAGYGNRKYGTKEEMIRDASKMMPFGKMLGSSGPTRKTVKLLAKPMEDIARRLNGER